MENEDVSMLKLIQNKLRIDAILQVEATWVRTHIKNRDMIKYFYMQSLAVKFDVKNKFLKDSDSDFDPARSFGNEQNL